MLIILNYTVPKASIGQKTPLENNVQYLHCKPNMMRSIKHQSQKNSFKCVRLQYKLSRRPYTLESISFPCDYYYQDLMSSDSVIDILILICEQLMLL